jgi:hypothetical protein
MNSNTRWHTTNLEISCVTERLAGEIDLSNGNGEMSPESIYVGQTLDSTSTNNPGEITPDVGTPLNNKETNQEVGSMVSQNETTVEDGSMVNKNETFLVDNSTSKEESGKAENTSNKKEQIHQRRRAA